MKLHKCQRAKTCNCDVAIALEPEETCPIHAAGEWPPRCEICGKFMRYKEVRYRKLGCCDFCDANDVLVHPLPGSRTMAGFSACDFCDPEFLNHFRRFKTPKAKKIETNIDKRWEAGTPHDPRSENLYKSLEHLDYTYGGDNFNFKSGGDGDNGEHLMYLLDIHFEMQDRDAANSKNIQARLSKI